MMLKGEICFHVSAASVAGTVYKKNAERAGQLLAGNCSLFPSMMTDCFNFPTHGCSASEPTTGGNNAPFPLKPCCRLCGALLLTNNPHYQDYIDWSLDFNALNSRINALCIHFRKSHNILK